MSTPNAYTLILMGGASLGISLVILLYPYVFDLVNRLLERIKK